MTPDREPAREHAVMPVVLLHALGIAFSYWFAHLLRFDFDIPDARLSMVATTFGGVVALKLIALYAFGAYRIVSRYIGRRDILSLLLATLCGTAFIALGDAIFLPAINIPRSVLIMDAVLTGIWVLAAYLAPYYAAEGLRLLRDALRPSGTPVAIVGAGDAGELLLREIERTPAAGVRVEVFLDDKRDKIGRRIHSVPVDGPIDEAVARLAAHGIRKAIIAIPSASPVRLREIGETLLKAGIAIDVLPSLEALSGAKALLGRLRKLEIEDLLRRSPVRRDPAILASAYAARTILVTGAAGSIGSELCRQLLLFESTRIVALDRAETPLVSLEAELRARYPAERVSFVLADVTDTRQLREVLRRHQPECVFHAAAVKHVPVAELSPAETVRVNVLGTMRTLEESLAAGVRRFLFISTDKAVRPANVMGATKRLAEIAVQSRGGMAVRFGNVLGSNGSVLNIFKEQIARGGPITVTHPEMRRFFMTIPEAVHLVLEASALGQPGGIYILDMGQPVKIVDLARDVVRLAGLEPDRDIPIIFTGVRPGERLNEDLCLDEEQVVSTAHPQIVMAQVKPPPAERVERWVATLESLLQKDTPPAQLVRALQEILPDFRPAEPPPVPPPVAAPPAPAAAEQPVTSKEKR